jgi:hypothetical protein
LQPSSKLNGLSGSGQRLGAMLTAIAPAAHALVTVSLAMTPHHQPSLFIDSVHI